MISLSHLNKLIFSVIFFIILIINSAFGEDDPEAKEAGKGLSLWSIVTDSIAALGKWFADLFDIDWNQLIADMTPDWVKKIPFVGLHAHSVAGSIFDAIGYPQEHMDFA